MVLHYCRRKNASQKVISVNFSKIVLMTRQSYKYHLCHCHMDPVLYCILRLRFCQLTRHCARYKFLYPYIPPSIQPSNMQQSCDAIARTMTIIIIITITMLIMLFSEQRRSKSWPGSVDECRTALSGIRHLEQANKLRPECTAVVSTNNRHFLLLSLKTD